MKKRYLCILVACVLLVAASSFLSLTLNPPPQAVESNGIWGLVVAVIFTCLGAFFIYIGTDGSPDWEKN